jgi:hypothetical protein
METDCKFSSRVDESTSSLFSYNSLSFKLKGPILGAHQSNDKSKSRSDCLSGNVKKREVKKRCLFEYVENLSQSLLETSSQQQQQQQQRAGCPCIDTWNICFVFSKINNKEMKRKWFSKRL